MVSTILLVFAFVLAFLGSGQLYFGYAPKLSLIAAALACYFLSLLLGGVHIG